MTAIERTCLYVVIGVLLFGCYTLFERHEGAVKCVNSDKAAVAAEQAHNATILINQQSAIAQEKKAYEDALLQPVSAPVVRLCYTAPTVPTSATSAGRTHAAVPLPSPDVAVTVSGPDIGGPSVQIGHDADSQIAGLQAYIKEICLK